MLLHFKLSLGHGVTKGYCEQGENVLDIIERLRDSRPQICGHCHKTEDQKKIEPFSCDSGQIFGICTY